MQNPAPAACAYDTATDAQLIANCNPWANRKAGDFMILWDQQGGSTDLFLRTWSGTAPNLTLGAPTLLNVAVSQAAYSADGFRGEAAVDLTATIFGGSTACKSFANTIPSTVTGNSDTADYKDTILKTAPPITQLHVDDGDHAEGRHGTETGTTRTSRRWARRSAPVSWRSQDSAVVDIRVAPPRRRDRSRSPCARWTRPDCAPPGGTSVGSTNLTGAAYPVTVQSPTAYVTSAGRYCWRADVQR